MIERKYFISGVCDGVHGNATFTATSWTADSGASLAHGIKRLSKAIGCDTTKLIVTSFNRI